MLLYHFKKLKNFNPLWWFIKGRGGQRGVASQILIIQYSLANPHHPPVNVFCFFHLFIKSNAPLRDCDSQDMASGYYLIAFIVFFF